MDVIYLISQVHKFGPVTNKHIATKLDEKREREMERERERERTRTRKRDGERTREKKES